MNEIINELRQINNTLAGMLETLKKPAKNRIMQIFEVAGACVGILGIISIIEIIRQWIMGG